MTVHDIERYIARGRRAHLVGIGGVSMAPLAEVLHGMGMAITGSDMRESGTVEHLRALGIPVAIGQGWKGRTFEGLGIGRCCDCAAQQVKGCPPSVQDIIDAL